MPDYSELLSEVKNLTGAVRGCAAALYLIFLVLFLKNMNSSSEIKSLTNELHNTGAKIAAQIEYLKGVFRKWNS